jgi:phosphatidylglycerophosphate synthase
MTKKQIIPYDQQLARRLVKLLSRSKVTPNQITTLTLFMALGSGFLFSQGDPVFDNWGAGIFILARFFDHFDGELARLQGKSSKFGYYFDYAAGGISYAVLFIGLGLGNVDGELGIWAMVLAGAGASAAIISLFSNLGIDERSDDLDSGDAIGYPEFAGFELEDGIYLLAPVTWFGFLVPFFIASGIGATVYCLWSIWSYVKLGTK